MSKTISTEIAKEYLLGTLVAEATYYTIAENREDKFQFIYTDVYGKQQIMTFCNIAITDTLQEFIAGLIKFKETCQKFEENE